MKSSRFGRLTAVAALSAVLAGMLFVGAGVSYAEEELRVAHILLRSKEEAEKVATEIQAGGNNAEAFKKACYKYSMDAGTKPLGGLLPNWLRKNGGYDAKFTAAAFTLDKGAISGPVLSQFGWHLIQVLDKREKGGAKPATDAADPAANPVATAQKIAAEQAAKAKAEAEAAKADAAKADVPETAPDSATKPGPNDVAKPANTGTESAVKTAPAETVVAKRRNPSTGRRIYLVLESVLSTSGAVSSGSQRNFSPDQAVELNVIWRNESADSVRVPAASIVPLGLVVAKAADASPISADYASMAEPAEFFPSLKTWGISGEVVSLNDYFQGLGQAGRYQVRWDSGKFLENLEARFPKAKDHSEYASIKAEFEKARGGVTVDVIQRDSSPAWASKSRTFQFSVFPRVKPEDKYYAKISFYRQTEPVVVELSSGKGYGNQQAVRQFVRLANEGFYDSLKFHDVRKGDYALGGCPQGTGLGAPSMRLPSGVSNTDNTSHARGTVSFVARRSPNQGPVRGGEIGSIFFVALADHPEWDDQHVPFGKVVEGIDVFDKLTNTDRIRSVEVITASDYSGTGATVADSGKTDADDSKIIKTGQPQAVIKTSKGDLQVTLYEDKAFHTVASFITRAEDGFFSKGDEEKKIEKMSFFESLEQEGKTLALMTGSPTNDGSGGPGYQLRDEVNSYKCERGALVMLKEVGEDGNYVPNSAGSQFFICVQPIPYYDFQGELTVFGKVTGGLDVLDKLAKGDELTDVEITKKKNRSYSSFRRAN